MICHDFSKEFCPENVRNIRTFLFGRYLLRLDVVLFPNLSQLVFEVKLFNCFRGLSLLLRLLNLERPFVKRTLSLGLKQPDPVKVWMLRSVIGYRPVHMKFFVFIDFCVGMFLHIRLTDSLLH